MPDIDTVPADVYAAQTARVRHLEAEVERLRQRERDAEARVVAGEGSHQDTALVAIKLGEDLLEDRAEVERLRAVLGRLIDAATEFSTAASYEVEVQIEEDFVDTLAEARAALEGGEQHG